MPPIFKALASITAWILFIGGCIATVATFISWLTKIGFIAIPSVELSVAWFVVQGALVSAVVVMRLRKALE